MFIGRWADKRNVVCTHTYTGILLSHKKEWNNAICSNRDRPRDYHTKWRESEKDKYHMILLICEILKNDTNGLTYKTEAGSHTWKTNMVTMRNGEIEKLSI